MSDFSIKRTFSLTLVILLVTSFMTTQAFAKDELVGHYAEEEIRALIEAGIMEGDSSGNFLPEREITRAEFVKLIVEGIGMSGGEKEVDFQDIQSSDWFYDYAITAGQLGITTGDGSGKFQPNRTITREEMAVMIKRALDASDVTLAKESLPFKDKNKISDWAIEDIQRLVGADIIKGELKNKELYFSPKKKAPRGQAAAFIYRTLHTIDPDRYPEILPVPDHQETPYNYTFDKMVQFQTNSTPKVDGRGTYTASEALVRYYVNPNNFPKDSREYYQFLVLSEPAGTVASELNSQFLKGKGTLEGQGDAFIEAASKHGINELYLISHAIHETGNGSSKLARGIEVGLNKDKKPEMVTDKNRKDLTKIKKTYNMFGVQAVDACPEKCGSEYAYEQGWFKPHDAIVGGAAFISENYIQNKDLPLNTLYKMRWNPESKEAGVLGRQYATHVEWATIQARNLADMYNKLSSYRARFDVPAFVSQPGKTSLPKPEDHYAVLKSSVSKAWTTSKDADLNVRTGPTTSFASVTKLPYRTEVTVLGKNGGWYKIKTDKHEGWVKADYLSSEKPKSISGDAYDIDEAIQLDVEPRLNKQTETAETAQSTAVYETKDLTGHVQTELPAHTDIVIVEELDDIYKITVDDITGYVDANDIQVTK